MITDNVIKFSKIHVSEQDVLLKIYDEVQRASEKHPSWPADSIHAAAIVSEESGELMRACVQNMLEEGDIQNCYTEAVHTAATAVRFLLES